MSLRVLLRDKKIGKEMILFLIIPFGLGLLSLVNLTPPWVDKVTELLHPRQRQQRGVCLSWQKQVYLSMRAYMKDYDELFPLVTTQSRQGLSKSPIMPVGWADAIIPKNGDSTILQCYADNHASTINPNLIGFTDYWLNGNLGGVPQKSVALPSQTLLVGDGNDGSDNSNATYNKTSFGSWLDDQSSPMYRHLGGANYLFVDGHIKWLKPDEVKNFGGRSDPFALK
jgi:prepilin-type processing-associated H-X9-DG protein